MKYQVILNVSDEHPALSPGHGPMGADVGFICRLAFQDWQGISVLSAEPLATEPPATTSESPTSATELASEVRERRERVGLSIRQLSERAGIDRAPIQRIEKGGMGGTPRNSTVGAIRRALDEAEAAIGAQLTLTTAPTEPAAPTTAAPFDNAVITVTTDDGLTLTVSGPPQHAEKLGDSVLRLPTAFAAAEPATT